MTEDMGLNPHVVGRFFRVYTTWKYSIYRYVLIPMWWGGFSEDDLSEGLIGGKVLIPMWWGGFSEAVVVVFTFNGINVLIPMWWGGFSERLP